MLYCAKPNGDIQYDFRGKLSFSWPRTGSQTAVNIGDSDYDPLFAYGYGLSYSDQASIAMLSEDAQLGEKAEAQTGLFLKAGVPVLPWRLVMHDAEGEMMVTTSQAISPSGAITMTALDHKAQEDSRLFVFSDEGIFYLLGENPLTSLDSLTE